MKLSNKTENNFAHTVSSKERYFLAAGTVAEIPDEVAKLWLQYEGVEEYVDPAEVEKLKAEVKKLKKATTTKK